MKLNRGDAFPTIALQNIHGAPVAIPDPETPWVHLQFRRFAGCPICNLHLQSFVQGGAAIKAAGIREVVVFHSSNEALRPYQGQFPFDVVGDPEKKLYRRFGVESSIWALLNPRAWPAIVRGALAGDKPSGNPDGGVLGPSRGLPDIRPRRRRRLPLRPARLRPVVGERTSRAGQVRPALTRGPLRQATDLENLFISGSPKDASHSFPVHRFLDSGSPSRACRK